ncbi:MAG: autotransporter-associated beta strand repeat-containing protein, partial [Bacteroidales bacterium]|nr:autotransporter-associated beta strand repeat-containing protein [Bacteroidales bacterium]
MKKILRFKHYILIELFVLLLSFGNMAKGASFTAIQNGNWNDKATWGSLSFPGTGDDISINPGITVTMNVAGECRAITDMPGGSISGSQSLTIAGNAGVVITIPSGTATISCPLILPANASISVDGTLSISGEISGAANDLIKNGTGKLILSGINMYDGTTTVNSGILNLQNGQGAGNPSNGIIVNNTAQLELESAPVMFINEPLSLSGTGISGSSLVNVSGTNIWLGPIDIDGAITSINSAFGDLFILSTLNLKANVLSINVTNPITSTLSMPGVIYTSTGTGSIVKEGSGELSFGSQLVVINSLTINQGTLKSTLGILSLAGDFSNNGTLDHNGGTVEFNGASAQSIGGSQQTIFNNLTLNNSAGAILGGSISIDGTLTLTDGRLNLGSYNLTLGSAAVASTPTVSNMIVADGTGECRRIFTADGSYVFPVGDVTGTPEYSPITLDFTSGTYSPGAYVGVKVTDGLHPENTNATDYISRYWSVSASGISSFTYDVTGTFSNSSDDITGNITNIITGMWDGASWQNNNPIVAPAISATVITSSVADFTGISSIPASLSVTITSVPSLTVCQGTLLTLSANPVGVPSFTYLWSPNGETTQSITPSTAIPGTTTYSVTVTDTDGNNAINQATVVVNELPTATISGSTTVCQNQSLPLITFTGTGGTAPYVFTYTFNGGVNANTSQGNPVSIDAVTGTPGTDKYDLVSVSDANTCSQSQSGEATVTIIKQPTLSNAALASTVCENSPAIINLEGLIPNTVFTLDYSINGVAQPPVSGLMADATGNSAFTTPNLSLANNGQTLQIAQITGTDVLPNCTQVFNQTIILDVTSKPVITLTDQTNINCFGNSSGAINLTITGGTPAYTYSWTRDGFPIAPVTEDLSGLSAGIYEVTVRDVNGCETHTSITISQADAISLLLTPTSASCSGGYTSISAAITGTPLSDLQINIDGGAFATVTASPVVFSSLTAGSHSLILRRISDNSCLVTESVSVTQPDVLDLVLSPVNATCFGGN